jgi:hypothetical protein
MPHLKHIESMLTLPVHNYIVPGLTSWLIGENPVTSEKVRAFTCSVNQQIGITPHNHRYDFQCQVLRGQVINTIWIEDSNGDEFVETRIKYGNEVGTYERQETKISKYIANPEVYFPGDWYGLDHDEIHSITFSKGAFVLFFEGKTLTNHSIMLEPYINGRHIPLGKVQDWMFQRE